MIDGALHGAVEGTRADPPATPVDGTAWLVASPASGDWSDHSGSLALRQAGQWFHIAPCDGMQLLDRSNGQIVHRIGGAWRRPAAPALPNGGTVIDAEARKAISALVAALQQWGAFSS